ncbi:glycosyltransferase family 2 protein [Pseudomonas sp. TNT3]|uniref:glycosyltransferase family 2 protein n=1 Tax=Pseudomonas sp. TNT3 TaxID=2654097 RepID=UPI00139094B9|nr:glycosyltransferase family 2 protein [Pseudomonas sp. TNT3]KAI2694272.1 glycosyltransferase family 2 protein [Pseudomonas sp. TNT3]
MKISVAAVVVLFKPDLVILDRLLKSLIGQVDSVYIVDNTPGADLESYPESFSGESWTYHPLKDNLGIARAHNAGIDLAREAGHSHVLLMDQDSALAPGTVDTLVAEEQKLLAEGKKVGAIGPVVVDEKTGEAAPAITPTRFGGKRTPIDLKTQEPVATSYIIASGSLISLSVLKTVGGMKDEFFIDWVDIEWGERAASFGYISYLTPLVSMRHSIGDEFVEFMGRKINLHTDFRNYFIVRNATYLVLWGQISIASRLQLARRVPLYVIYYSLCSRRKWYSAKLLCLAVYDGVIKKMFKGRF